MRHVERARVGGGLAQERIRDERVDAPTGTGVPKLNFSPAEGQVCLKRSDTYWQGKTQGRAIRAATGHLLKGRWEGSASGGGERLRVKTKDTRASCPGVGQREWLSTFALWGGTRPLALPAPPTLATSIYAPPHPAVPTPTSVSIQSPSHLQPSYGARNLNSCGRYRSWRLYRRRLSSTHARHRSHSYSWRYRRFSGSRLVHSIPFRVYAYPSPTSRSSTAASASTDCRYFWVCYSSLRGRRNSYFHSLVGHSRINSCWYSRLSRCLFRYRQHPCGSHNHRRFYAPRSGALRSLT